MDELVLQDKPGFFSRLGGFFTRPLDDEDDMHADDRQSRVPARPTHRYALTIRRHVSTFDDAMAAAMGFKRGEQQILNLTGTEPAMRQKIVDFMSGVNFAQEGTWEEIGEDIYLVAPGFAFVEVAPATPRSSALRN